MIGRTTVRSLQLQSKENWNNLMSELIPESNKMRIQHIQKTRVLNSITSNYQNAKGAQNRGMNFQIL
jgi:hypothetical protein